MDVDRAMNFKKEDLMDSLFVNQDLEKDYNRWLPIAMEEDSCISECKVIVSDVLRAHYTIVDYFLEDGRDESAVGGIGPRDMPLLVSAVSRQAVVFDEREKWRDDIQKAATLTYGIVKNHPFHDCNKRTGLLSLMYYMYLLSRVPKVKQREFEKLMLLIADNKLQTIQGVLRVKAGEDLEVRIIEEFIRKKTRRMDKRHYFVTFNELQSILGRFGFGLDNPKGNFIDLVRCDEDKKGSVSYHKIATLGFPGWTRKVALKDLKAVRKKTGLTAENGYDSAVFYRGIDPLKVLVDDYSGPLRRLANR